MSKDCEQESPILLMPRGLPPPRLPSCPAALVSQPRGSKLTLISENTVVSAAFPVISPSCQQSPKKVNGTLKLANSVQRSSVKTPELCSCTAGGTVAWSSSLGEVRRQEHRVVQPAWREWPAEGRSRLTVTLGGRERPGKEHLDLTAAS